MAGDFNEESFNDPISINIKPHFIDLYTIMLKQTGQLSDGEIIH